MLGTGIVKGLTETARNFFGSFVDKDRLTTVQFPEERLPVAEAARNFPFLIYDGPDSEQGLRCVACQICEKECPPRCITIEKSKEKKPDFVGKPQFYPAVFNIDVSVCMSCQICVEVCPFDAIRMDNDFELSTSDRFAALLWTKEKLARPNEHYLAIHPTEAAEVEARRARGEGPGRSQKDGGQIMLDQLFPLLKHWLLSYAPPRLQPAVAVLLTIVPHPACLPGSLRVDHRPRAQRPGPRMQNRYGPNRVGIFGILQPMADAVKSLTKEDVVPAAADHVVHFLAPLVLLAVAFLPYAVLPIGRNMVAANLDAGVLFFFAIGAVSELSVFMAGWSSRNKYSLLGAMRAVAQMISYEVPLLLTSIAVIMAAGSLSTVEIVQQQIRLHRHFPSLVRAHALGLCRLCPLYDRGHR